MRRSGCAARLREPNDRTLPSKEKEPPIHGDGHQSRHSLTIKSLIDAERCEKNPAWRGLWRLLNERTELCCTRSDGRRPHARVPLCRRTKPVIGVAGVRTLIGAPLQPPSTAVCSRARRARACTAQSCGLCSAQYRRSGRSFF